MCACLCLCDGCRSRLIGRRDILNERITSRRLNCTGVAFVNRTRPALHTKCAKHAPFSRGPSRGYAEAKLGVSEYGGL